MGVMVSIEPKAAVAHLLKSISEDILDLLPRVFPRTFTCEYLPIAEHQGTRCVACNSEPILGPRFHNNASAIDLCGECYIDFAFDASTNFECHLAAASTGHCADPWKDGAKCWKELAGAFFGKGKGKGKRNGPKGWGRGLWNHCGSQHMDTHPAEMFAKQMMQHLFQQVEANPGLNQAEVIANMMQIPSFSFCRGIDRTRSTSSSENTNSGEALQTES